jgi:hypothetical protein
MHVTSHSPKIANTATEKEKEKNSTNGNNKEDFIFEDNNSTFSESFPKKERKSEKAKLLKIRLIKILWEFLTQLSLTVIFSMKV